MPFTPDEPDAPGRRSPVQVMDVVDFTGGLNTADPFKLRPNESPDLQNVALDPRGGFRQRPGIAPLNYTKLAAAPQTLYSYLTTDNSVDQIVCHSGSNVFYSTGADFTSMSLGMWGPERTRFAVFNDVLYMVNGTDKPYSWDGSTATQLNQTFNDDLTSPDDGDMPIARLIAEYRGYLWLAYTTESSTDYPNRLRFSHPNKAEDWRTDDHFYVDDGEDGDFITALVPMEDRLYVFKNRSIHVVQGYDLATFQVTKISDTVGTPSQESVVVTDAGIFFYCFPQGVYHLDGNSVKWTSERIERELAEVNEAENDKVTLGWLNRKVFVSFPTGSATVNTRTVVNDLELGDRNLLGAWTVYDVGFGPMIEHRPPSKDATFLASGQNDVAFGLALDGSSGTYAAGEREDPWAPTTDLQVEVSLLADDWTPSSAMTIYGVWDATADERGWKLDLETDGDLTLSWSTDGKSGTVETARSTAGINSVVGDGERIHVKVVLDVDNGASGSDVDFYYSQDGVNWSALGATVTGGATTSVHPSTAVLAVGADSEGNQLFEGTIYSLKAKDGIDGGLITDPVWDKLSPVDLNGVTYTSMGDAALGETAVRSVLRVELDGTWTDDFGDGPTNVPAYFVTAWFAPGGPAVDKRWRKPELVVDTVETATLKCKVFHDYDLGSSVKEFNVTLASEESANVLVWGTGTWGNFNWGGDRHGKPHSIERLRALGRSRSVALMFVGPRSSARWMVDSLSLKYKPRRVR